MGMIYLGELNDIIANTLYIGSGNQRRENENFWKDLRKAKFEGYECGSLLSELHKCNSSYQDSEEIERLARLLDWKGDKFDLSGMLAFTNEIDNNWLGECR